VTDESLDVLATIGVEAVPAKDEVRAVAGEAVSGLGQVISGERPGVPPQIREEEAERRRVSTRSAGPAMTRRSDALKKWWLSYRIIRRTMATLKVQTKVLDEKICSLVVDVRPGGVQWL
jgi:hypothetical protein